MGKQGRPVGHLLPIIILYGLLIGGGVYKVLLESLGYIPALGMTDLTLTHYGQVLSSPGFIRDLVFTLFIALTAATLSVVIGTLLAFRLTRTQIPWLKSLVAKVMQFGMVLPYLYMIFMVTLLFSKTGLYSRFLFALGAIEGLSDFPTLIYEPYGIGILLVFILKGIPFVTLFLLNMMDNINTTYDDVASSLGAGSFQLFRRVYLPLCSDLIVWTLMVLLAYDIGAFEVPYLLGSLKPQVLSVKLFSAYMSPSVETVSLTMAIALLLFIIGLLLVTLYSRFIKFMIVCPWHSRSFSRLLKKSKAMPTKKKTTFQWMDRLMGVALVTFALIPILYMLLLSGNTFFKYPLIFPINMTNNYWDNLLFHNSLFYQGLLNSLFIGGLTAILATLIGFTAARGIVRYYKGNPKTILVLISIPLFIPGMSLFLGAHQVLIHTPFANHWTGVVLAHLLICIPYTTNTALAYFRGIPLELEQVAQTLGTNKFALYKKVLLPLLLPGLTLAAGISFLISNTEYFSTFIIGGGNTVTLSMVMFPYIANSDYGMSSATGIVFILLHLLLFLLIDRLLLQKVTIKALYGSE